MSRDKMSQPAMASHDKIKQLLTRPEKMTQLLPSQALDIRQLREIFLLRNITLTGIIISILTAQFLLDIKLPVLSLYATSFLLISFNAFVWVRIEKGNNQVSHSEFFSHLIIDTLFLAAFLFLSGGASNPFSLVFLIPVIISATVLPVTYTWALALLTIAIYSLFIFIYGTAHNMHSEHNSSFSLHIFGMWLGFTFGTLIVVFFVTRIGRLLRKHQDQLYQANEQALRDEQLVVLGTLAASTAHEINTPLATVSLLTQELLDGNHSDDENLKLQLLQSQIDRCTQALENLSTNAGDLSLRGGRSYPANQFIQELLDGWKHYSNITNFKVKVDGQLPAPWILVDDTLKHAMHNILDNAFEASPDNIEIHADWDLDIVWIDIIDNGPGVDRTTLIKLGHTPISSKNDGMGLGLFIAYSVIRRFGGEVSMINRETGGIHTHIKLPVNMGLKNDR